MNIRKKDSHRKFLLGLSFEKSDLAFAGKEYRASESVDEICQKIKAALSHDDYEHQAFKRGRESFDSENFMLTTQAEQIDNSKQRFGDEWKKTRYHNLVRIGGDVLAQGLGEYNKATLLGALLMYRQKEFDYE